MSNLAKKLVDSLASKEIFPAEDREIYLYGTELLISSGSFCLFALLFGLVMGNLSQIALFLAVFFPIRSFAGGYHAESGGKCLLLSIGIMLIVWLLYPFVPLQLTWGMAVLSAGIVFRYAPVVHPSSPHSPEHQAVLRQRARVVALLVLATVILLGFYEAAFASLAALTYFTAACSAWFAAVRENNCN